MNSYRLIDSHNCSKIPVSKSALRSSVRQTHVQFRAACWKRAKLIEIYSMKCEMMTFSR